MTYLATKELNTITKAPALFGSFSAVLEQPWPRTQMDTQHQVTFAMSQLCEL